MTTPKTPAEAVVEEVPFECAHCGETHSNTLLERTGGKCPNLKKPRKRTAFVSLDDLYAVECRLDPSQRWNGFACPFFTREQLSALFTMINEGGGMKARLDSDDIVRVISPDYGEDEPEEFDATVVDGVQMWAVGAWCWAWDTDPEGMTSTVCPACEQHIYRNESGTTECGGKDDGTCAAVNYASDVARGISDPEWLADDCDPPSHDLQVSALAAHLGVSDDRVPEFIGSLRREEVSSRAAHHVDTVKDFSRAAGRLLQEWDRLQNVVPGSEESPGYPFGEDFEEVCLKISAWSEAVEKQYEGSR